MHNIIIYYAYYDILYIYKKKKENMKSYNHLYEKFIETDNIKLAIEKSSIGKRDREDVQYYYYNMNDEDIINKIRKYAMNFKNKEHKPIEIYDGIVKKVRIIVVPKYEEQIIHHMVINVLEPIFLKGMYEHSNGSIPGRGIHRTKKYTEKFIRKKENKKHIKYCLKMDIKKYFNTIPHDKLIEKLEKIIHDEKFMDVLRELISATDEGIPLGFYTSQWFANWYLQDLDHYIKEELHAKFYTRYMDDMVIFGSNKRKLHDMQIKINEYLNNKLGLKMKENWQVFRFDYIKDGEHRGRCLDFVGYKFYRDKTTLRKSIMFRILRKSKKMSKKDKITVYDCRQILSYIGWIDSSDTYNIYLTSIERNISFQYCKRKVSKYDKEKNKQKKRKENIYVA